MIRVNAINLRATTRDCPYKTRRIFLAVGANRCVRLLKLMALTIRVLFPLIGSSTEVVDVPPTRHHERT
jgi:hypothetical protein